MEEENTYVRRLYGGCRSKIMRFSSLFLRRIERFIRGGYKRVEICYYYAVDEIPNYRLIKAKNIGGRYTIPRNLK